MIKTVKPHSFEGLHLTLLYTPLFEHLFQFCNILLSEIPTVIPIMKCITFAFHPDEQYSVKQSFSIVNNAFMESLAFFLLLSRLLFCVQCSQKTWQINYPCLHYCYNTTTSINFRLQCRNCTWNYNKDTSGL